MNQRVEIFRLKNNESTVEVAFENDTVWLSQKQIATLFEQSKQNISLHINNCFKDKELEKSSTVKKSLTVQKEGKRSVRREIELYNLDVIISVGYRVNSKKGIEFRKWATQRLKEHLVHGFSINEERLKQKEQEVIHLKTGIKILSRAIEEKSALNNTGWIRNYSVGLKLLDDYDHQNLDNKGSNEHPIIYPTTAEYQNIISVMTEDFDSEIFGREKDGGFRSAIEQIKKGYSNHDFYPTLEEKAATLLYLIIKNHAFVDGNKRIAAACFLLFLEKNNLIFLKNNELRISNEALASLTLFVASSRAEEMNITKNLIISILNRSSK